jgi:hypothetical protein
MTFEELVAEAQALGVNPAMISSAQTMAATKPDEAHAVLLHFVGVERGAKELVAKVKARTNGAAPAPTTTPTPATPKPVVPAVEPPKGLEDKRLKIPARHRAVWRVLYRWAGSSRRMDRVVVSNLTAVARTLRPDWGGFSTRAVRSAITYLGAIGAVDVRREPQTVAQRDGWRRGPDGQFKEAPFEIHVPLVTTLAFDVLVAKIKAMPAEAKMSEPSAAARMKRYRDRLRGGPADPVTEPQPIP